MKKLILVSMMLLVACGSDSGGGPGHDDIRGSNANEKATCNFTSVELQEYPDGTSVKWQIDVVTKYERATKGLLDGTRLIQTKGERDQIVYRVRADGSKYDSRTHGETFSSVRRSKIEKLPGGLRKDVASVTQKRKAKPGSYLVDKNGKKVETLERQMAYEKVTRVEGDIEYPVSYKEDGRVFEVRDYVTKVSESERYVSTRTVLRTPYTTKTSNGHKWTVLSEDESCYIELAKGLSVKP